MTLYAATPLSVTGSACLPFSNRELALALAAANIPIFPCREGGTGVKKTRVKAPYTQAGFKEATADPAIVKVWWDHWPDALPGIVPGMIGALVIDCDVKRGVDGLKAWEDFRGETPQAPFVYTPSMGVHLWYRAPEGHIGNSRGGLPAGIDVRCDAGYVCMGTLADGRGYLPPADTDLYAILTDPESDLEAFFPDLPAHVVAAIAKPKTRAKSGLKQTPGLWALINEREIEKATAALAALPDSVVEDREQWIRIGAALHNWSGGATEGWRLYDKWSQRAANYGGTREAWESFSLDKADGVTIATLFHMAGEHGWTARPVEVEAAAEALPRVVLDLGGNYMADYTLSVEKTLIERGVRMYDRGGILVRLGVEHTIDANKRRTTTPMFFEVDEAHMRYVLSQHFNFRVFDARSKDWRVKNPPADLVKSLMCRAGQWPYAPVATISATPTINSTGDLLDTEGLDQETGIFVMNPVVLPKLRFGLGEAREAVATLKTLVRECPFVDEASRSVALSALITPVVRGCMDVAPAHAVTAPAAGTGKSYLFDMAAAIVTGMVCPAMAAGKNEEELEKRLGAWALKGAPIIQIDNAINDIGGDALCQLIERPMVNLRILGSSNMVRAQNRQTVFINGNNLVLYGDMIRRTLIASMDAGMERPGERAFEERPLNDIMTRRGYYIAACLTVVLSYLKAGSPDMGLRPMNSFQMWSDSVRSALVWCGEPDPCFTMERAREDDPEMVQLEAVIEGMREMKLGYENAASISTLVAAGSNMKLQEALQPWYYGSRFNSNMFGRWLTKNKERRVGGFSIRKRILDGITRWYIVEHILS